MWRVGNSSVLLRSIFRGGVIFDFVPIRACHSHCGHAANKKWTRPKGYDTGIKVFNSLTKQKEPLILPKHKVATWYSCGPTVYDHAHLGHACSYVRFDIVQRILTRVFGVTLIHAMVITDIDDKIIKRSVEENIAPSMLTRLYEDEFKKDMLLLKVNPPLVYLRVTENVHHIVTFIEQIIRNGHAYATCDGDVYFDIQSIGDRYGRFIGAMESQETVSSNKKDPRDFALWKASKPREPFWESPWGRGRPGWHIECSTVASSVFGSQLDIHSGGIDLAFPHHENEIAQSEAYHQCGQWCNYFLHSGHLHLKGQAQKMSKSLKNYITIKDFLRAYSASEFRMFCLLTKYRSGIDYSEGSMLEARATLETLSAFLNTAQAYMKGQLHTSPIQEALLWEKLEETKQSTWTALADDFDTPRALSAVLNLVYFANCQLQPMPEHTGEARCPAVLGALVSYILDILDMFGIDAFQSLDLNAPESVESLEAILDLVTQFRSKVRAFALSRQEPCNDSSKPTLYPERLPLLEACDSFRDDLAVLGVVIKDRGAASTWESTRRRLSPTGSKPEHNTSL